MTDLGRMKDNLGWTTDDRGWLSARTSSEHVSTIFSRACNAIMKWAHIVSCCKLRPAWDNCFCFPPLPESFVFLSRDAKDYWNRKAFLWLSRDFIEIEVPSSFSPQIFANLGQMFPDTLSPRFSEFVCELIYLPLFNRSGSKALHTIGNRCITFYFTGKKKVISSCQSIAKSAWHWRRAWRRLRSCDK